MARRNTTHLSRLARAVAQDTTLSYAQALARCQDAAHDGLLPHPLDDAGMADAAQRITRSVNAGVPLARRTAGPAVLGVDEAGQPVTLTWQSLLTHTLVLGPAASGRDAGVRALADVYLEQNWPVLVLDFAPPTGPDALRAWRTVATARGTTCTTATPASSGFTAPGVTYVPVPVPAESTSRVPRAAADLALATALDGLADRFADRPETPAMLVLSGALGADQDMVRFALARGRGAALAVVTSWPSVEDIGDYYDARRVLDNVDTVLAYNPASARAAGAASVHLSAARDTAPELMELPAGAALLRTTRPSETVRRIVVKDPA